MMRCFALFLLLAAAPVAHGDAGAEGVGGGSIGKVVKLLKEMLKKSNEDGNRDRKMYAKFKCYCDENTDEKTDSIKELTEEIALLKSDIKELQADTAKRSQENGELRPMLEDNERARSTAESIRSKENDAFKAEESDLKAAIGQMDDAIEELSKVGADQTVSSGADNAKFMAGKFVQMDNVREAIRSAAVFAGPKQRKVLTAFVQAPFTGTYTSQSGEIVGILKNMLDTFKENLKKAQSTEASAVENDNSFMKVKTDNYDEMKDTFETNESQMGTNDESLSTKRGSLSEAEDTLADDSEFLAKLTPICKTKERDFETRKMIRSNEEAAVAQAVAVLNSDAATESFGKADSTKSAASFLQVGAATRHKVRAVRVSVKGKLQKAARALKSLKLARVAALLEDNGNPLDKVVTTVTDMIAVIGKEEQEDDEQKAWCDEERETSHETKENKKKKIDTLKDGIDKKDDDINNKKSGMKAQLETAGKDLKQNRKDQKALIEERSEDNANYQKEIENLNVAVTMLDKAMTTLQKFYTWLEAKTGPHHYEKKEGKDSGGGNIKKMKEATIEELEEACSDDAMCIGFNSAGYLKKELKPEEDWYSTDESLYVKVMDKSLVQVAEDPAPPKTFDETSDEQSQSKKGNSVIDMIQEIKDEVMEEMAEVHRLEEAGQHEFEKEMDTLKGEEADLLESIANLEQGIKNTEADIEAKHEDREKTELEKKNTERYIEKIKPGCDFITENIDERKKNRKGETKALNGAIDELEGTPAYQEAEAAAEAAALGECADRCGEGERESLPCKACVGGMSVAGYCAAHSDEAGCE